MTANSGTCYDFIERNRNDKFRTKADRSASSSQDWRIFDLHCSRNDSKSNSKLLVLSGVIGCSDPESAMGKVYEPRIIKLSLLLEVGINFRRSFKCNNCNSNYNYNNCVLSEATNLSDHSHFYNHSYLPAGIYWSLFRGLYPRDCPHRNVRQRRGQYDDSSFGIRDLDSVLSFIQASPRDFCSLMEYEPCKKIPKITN